METKLEPLALRPKQAAKLLGISERTLFEWTQPRGPLRVRRLKRATLYSVEDLRAWLAADDQGG